MKCCRWCHVLKSHVMVRSRFTFPETDIVTPYWYTPTSPNAEITNTRSSLNTYPGVHKSSRLDYCNLGLLLYGVSDNLIRRVQSAQNAAARLLTGAGRRDHISPVLRQLHWLPVHRVQRRVDYKLYVLSSRLCLASHLHTSPSTYIWSPKVIDGGYALPPTDRVPFHAHNTFGVRCFAVAGPRVWNSLPAHLHDEDISYNSFKRELKTFLF